MVTTPPVTVQRPLRARPASPAPAGLGLGTNHGDAEGCGQTANDPRRRLDPLWPAPSPRFVDQAAVLEVYHRLRWSQPAGGPGRRPRGSGSYLVVAAILA